MVHFALQLLECTDEEAYMDTLFANSEWLVSVGIANLHRQTLANRTSLLGDVVYYWIYVR